MPLRNDRAIALVGLRGAGKSTVGLLLAAKLGAPFVDLDDEIAREVKVRGIAHGDTTAGAFFASHGPEQFRAVEAAVLEAVLAQSPTIVLACGGGVVESDANRALLRERARCVWLSAASEVLAARVDADSTSRPPLALGGSLAEARELAVRRSRWYREISVLEIDSGVLTPREVASQIAVWSRRRA